MVAPRSKPIATDAKDMPPLRTTLLELVNLVSEITEDEAETVASVFLLLASGSVELIGSFKDHQPEILSHAMRGNCLTNERR